MTRGRGVKKEHTELLKVRVNTSVADFLRAKAAHADMPITELGGALLEYAAHAEAQEEGVALLLPTVRHVIREELNLFLERTFDFQVRTYMEAGTARRMVQAVMHYGHNIAVERIKVIEEKQWSQTWAASKKHFDGQLEMKRLLGHSEELAARRNELSRSGAAADQFGPVVQPEIGEE